LLGEALEGAVGRLLLELHEALDRAAHGLEVGQHAAQPAVADVGHAATLGFLADHVARGALGADEQDAAAVGGKAADEVERVLEQRDGLLEVDDVDLGTLAEDVGSHLRVPEAGLVTEMHASFKHLAHGNVRHVLLQGLGLHASQTTTRFLPGTPPPVSKRVSIKVLSLLKKRALYTIGGLRPQTLCAPGIPPGHPCPGSIMTVTIKTPEEIEKMRVAGRLAAEVLEMIEEYVKPGVTTGELDRICHDYIVNTQQAI